MIKDFEMRLSWIISSNVIVSSDIITRVFVRGEADQRGEEGNVRVEVEI